jgi:hypothetical protein
MPNASIFQRIFQNRENELQSGFCREKPSRAQCNSCIEQVPETCYSLSFGENSWYSPIMISPSSIDVANDCQADWLDSEVMEHALDKAIVLSENVLRLLIQTENELPGKWGCLLGSRRRDTQPSPEDEALFNISKRILADLNG